jgi:polynucleotide 5'-hydroxyl-kinase GRC3/NOL9
MKLEQENIAASLRSLPRGAVVLLLGEVDTGKSTLADNLVKRAGFDRVALVDTDVGQGVLAPPAVMGAALVEPDKPTSIIAMRFIGAVSPVRHMRDVCEGAQQLLNIVRRRDPEIVFVDTCGLVRGRIGVNLKLRLIRTLRPDVVLAVSRSGELDPILKSITPLELDSSSASTGDRKYMNDKTIVWEVSPSEHVRRKTPTYRRRVRAQRFASALARARRVTFSIMPTVGGIVQNSAEFLHFIAVRPKDFEHLLVGLIDRHGLCLGIGTLDDVDRDDGSISISTAVRHVERTVVLRFGDLIIAPNGSTLGEIHTNPAEIPVSLAQPDTPNAR